MLIKLFTANGSIREIVGAENLVQIGVTSKFCEQPPVGLLFGNFKSFF